MRASARWLLQLQQDFLTPMSRKMEETMNEYLQSEKIDAKERLESLNSVYEIAKARIPQWPFDPQVIAELTGSIILPLIIVLIQFLIGR